MARDLDAPDSPDGEDVPDLRAYDEEQDDQPDKDAYVKSTHPTTYTTSADGSSDNRPRRKSATISFHCDPEQLFGQVGVSFVAADPDDCAYFFEVRSQHACARAEPHQPGSVGPGSVFAIILAITVLVYFGGGVFYQRTVAHARGWRQLPNYTLWAGIWNFISVCLSSLVHSVLSLLCCRFLRRGKFN